MRVFFLHLWAATVIRQCLGIWLTLPGISVISFTDVHDLTALAPTRDAQLVSLGGAKRCGSSRLHLTQRIPRIKSVASPICHRSGSKSHTFPRSSCMAPSPCMRLSCSGLLTLRYVIHVQFKGPNFTEAMLIYPS